MNTSHAIEILTEWITCNNLQRPKGEPKVRMDRELEEVRDWLLAKLKHDQSPETKP